MLIKSLIGLELGSDGISLSELVRDQKVILRKPMFCSPNTSIIEMLGKFKEGRSHLAMITEDPVKREKFIEAEENQDESLFQEENYTEKLLEKPPQVLGLVTIEDVIEMLINSKISDEHDYDKQFA